MLAPLIDLDDTPARLVDAAAHLFARRGIEAVPMRDVGAQAGTRNASAVQYHFGGRWDLVEAILHRHSRTVTGWDPTQAASVEDIVQGLVALLRPKLADPEGRDFLRVVFELMTRYPGRWDHDPATNRGLANLAKRLVSLMVDLPAPLARARAVAMTQFVTSQMAERSRLIDEGARRSLSDDAFTSNLILMSIAMLKAPAPSTSSSQSSTTSSASATAIASPAKPPKRRRR